MQLLAIGPGAGGKNCKISATGFFVNEDGYLVTNAHVVDDARRCLAMSPEAKILAKLASPAGRAAPAVSCDVVGVDEVHDIAVLKTERRPAQVLGTEIAPFALLDSEEMQPGAPVVLTGHPTFAWQPVTQRGWVLRRGSLRLTESSSESTEVLAVNIAPQVGNSGSPVYLPTGEVVAIVERKDPADASNTIAVPIRHAVDLLNRLGVTWHAARR
ncbi:MAG: serine protease [Acidobacteriia bacterium]|nr:serine protease [Terriglobia bacterium]